MKTLKFLILMLAVLMAGFVGCQKGDTNSPEDDFDNGDSYVSYQGVNQTLVKQLLSNVKGWSTPTCLTCNGTGTPPNVSIGTKTCIRDTYVAAAIQFAWAAEGYYRLKENQKAQDAAATMKEQLSIVDLMCKNGGISIGGSDCQTFTIYPCQDGGGDNGGNNNGGNNGGGNNNGGNNNGGNTANGKVTFWTKAATNTTTITINGTSRTITQNYTSVTSCGGTGNANFDLAPGTYTFTASGGLNGNGSIVVTANGCLTYELVQSGSGGNGTGTGGTAKGRVGFWTAGANPYGIITVTINGTSKATSQSSNSSNPTSCDANTSANFELAPGTYNYTAHTNFIANANSRNWNWSGTVTITSNGCTLLQLK